MCVCAALEHYGIAPEEAIAFSDGENDLSLFDAAGTGMAMDNAWGSVKECADYVTTDLDGDGIWNACKRFRLAWLLVQNGEFYCCHS